MNRMIPTLVACSVALFSVTARGEGVSARLDFDHADQALNGGNGHKNETNDQGLLAFGESWVMMSYAAMFRGTKDPRYLVKLADHVRDVLAQRDSVRGVDDFTARSRSCWQSTAFSGGGNEAHCWVLHAGLIVYPIVDFVRLVQQNPELEQLSVPGGGTVKSISNSALTAAEESVQIHDAQFHEISADEGYYRGDPLATFDPYSGAELPKHHSAAMGRALIALWQATSDSEYQQRARQIAGYLDARMVSQGSAWVWSVVDPEWQSPGDGQEIDDAAIVADFVVLAHEHGLTFQQADVERLVHTVFDMLHVDTQHVADKVDGEGATNSHKFHIGRWLNLTPYDVRVYAVAANLFVDVDEGPAETLLGLAQLARFAPPLVHFGFHSNPAWQLLADTRKASSNNSKITFIPPDTQQYAMLRVSYRSFNENVVQQYSGSWVDQLRLATDSDLTGAVLCFNPEVYSPFQGKAAFNFRESPWNNNGIEIKAVSEVQLPSITTTALPAAVVDESYEFTFSAAGDAPFSWRLVHAPAGMTIDHMSGEISFTPEQEDTPFVSVTVRLDNDSGSDTQTFNLVVDDSAPTDGGSGDSGADAGAEDGAVADQGTTEAGGDGNSGDAGDGGDDDGGCCSTSGGGGGPALAAVLLLLFLGRRRRARR